MQLRSFKHDMLLYKIANHARVPKTRCKAEDLEHQNPPSDFSDNPDIPFGEYFTPLNIAAKPPQQIEKQNYKRKIQRIAEEKPPTHQ